MFICVMKENSSFNKSKNLQNSSNNKLRPRIKNFISCLSPFFFILFFPNILSLLGCLSVSFYVSVLNTKKICCLINSVTITSHLIEARATCCCSDESSCWHWRAVAGTCWLPLSPAWCLYKGSIKTMIQGTRETTDWVARRCWWGATWTGTPSLALPGLLNSKEAWSLSAGFINSSAQLSFLRYHHYQGLYTCSFPQSQSWCRCLWFLTITWPWLSILVTAFLHPSIYFLLKISRYFNLLNAAVCCFVCRHNESSCFLMMRDVFID